MESSHQLDEDNPHSLPSRSEDSATLGLTGDSRREASSSLVNRHDRCARHCAVTAPPESAREPPTEDIPGGQGQVSGRQSLSRSWNGFHGNGCVYGHRERDGSARSKSVTSPPSLLDSPHRDVTPKTPLVKAEDNDVDDASRRRLQRRLMTSVSVAVTCYVTGMLSLALLQSQYLFRRFAVDYFNLTNVTTQQVPCAEGRNDSLQDDLNKIQAKTSEQILLMDYAQFVPAIFVSLFIGSYADYLGRKYLIFVPLMGAFLKSLVILLVVYLDLDIIYLYLAYAVEGFSGSFYALVLGLSASIADVTISSRQRVLLFALLDIVLAMAGAVSHIGTGYLIKVLGFTVPSLVVCCLFVIACVFLLIFMPETLRRPDRIVLNPLVHLRKVFGFYLFDGSALERGLFIMGLLLFLFITMNNLGKMTVETLFTMNSPFCWNPVEIGIFSGLRILVQNLSGVLIIKVLSKWVRIEVICMLGLLSGMAANTLEAFANSNLMMYISAVTGLIVTVASPIVRTLLSRMAPAKSQGALFASVSAVETVCHLVSTTVYNQVYMATLDIFPGAIFLLMTAFLFVDFVLLIIFTIVSRKVIYFKDTERDVKIDTGATICPPSPSSSYSDDDETQPLLEHRHNSATQQGRVRPTGMKSERQHGNQFTSSC